MTLAGEVELLRLERKIEDDVRGALFQNQREFYLQEQLRAIHRELGNEDGDEVQELDAQLVAANLPEAVLTRARREVRKLQARWRRISHPRPTVEPQLPRLGAGHCRGANAPTTLLDVSTRGRCSTRTTSGSRT
ncbi:MAG: hypothetical protein U5K74_13760 [Gemmatimonadaceae bacterium]|nr:hypothetical protein [Gemmatimonadaceae bacterium]